MNPHSSHLQSGQVRFGGCRLVSLLDSSPGGMVSWLAESGGRTCLLHVLPHERLLTEEELRPLHRLRHHGQRAGRAARQAAITNLCTEDGRAPVTALVESFPPLPAAATEWLTVMDWVKRHGMATSAQLRPLLPMLAQRLADLPDDGHGSLGPGRIWLACDGTRLEGVVFSHAGLTPPASPDSDLRGLATALFYALTGKVPPAHAARMRALLHEARHGQEGIPARWQEAIATSLDTGATLPPASAQELIDHLLDEGRPGSDGDLPLPPPPAPPVPMWIKASALAATAVLGFILFSVLAPKAPQTVQVEPPMPLPQPLPEPEFIPLPPPAPSPPEPDEPPVEVVETPAPMPSPVDEVEIKPPPAPGPVEKGTKGGEEAVVRLKPLKTDRSQSLTEARRVPYRPPPLVVESKKPRSTPEKTPKKAPAPPLPKAGPGAGEMPVPKAIPVARAHPVSAGGEPVLWRRPGSTETITRAVPVPELVPAYTIASETSGLIQHPGMAGFGGLSLSLQPTLPAPAWLEEMSHGFHAHSFLPDAFHFPRPSLEWLMPLWDWLPWHAPATLPPQATTVMPSRARIIGQPDQPLWVRP